MTMALPSNTAITLAAAHAPIDAKARDLYDYDTGQLDTGHIDTNQLEALARDVVIAGDLITVEDGCHASEGTDTELAVSFHEIHRIDDGENGKKESITSTLKYFSLHLAVQDSAGNLQFHLDGTTLVASLVYEDGEPVEDLSATHEPPLLAAAGESPPKIVVEGGVAVLRLRITVLSSLCNKRSFCVRVASADGPELVATTQPVKTITKLRRTPRDGARGSLVPAPASPLSSPLLENRAPAPNAFLTPATGGACGAKRGFDVIREDIDCQTHGKGGALNVDCDVIETELGGTSLDEVRTPPPSRARAAPTPHTRSLRAVGHVRTDGDDALRVPHLSRAQLWDQVAQNGARLLELQAQQRRLFKELRALKYTPPVPATP